MELNNIESLLEKYEEGQTTLQEEAQLKHYFTTETVAPHLEVYRSLFAYFVSGYAAFLPKTFTSRPRSNANNVPLVCFRCCRDDYVQCLYDAYLSRNEFITAF